MDPRVSRNLPQNAGRFIGLRDASVHVLLPEDMGQFKVGAYSLSFSRLIYTPREMYVTKH